MAASQQLHQFPVRQGMSQHPQRPIPRQRLLLCCMATRQRTGTHKIQQHRCHRRACRSQTCQSLAWGTLAKAVFTRTQQNMPRRLSTSTRRLPSHIPHRPLSQVRSCVHGCERALGTHCYMTQHIASPVRTLTTRHDVRRWRGRWGTQARPSGTCQRHHGSRRRRGGQGGVRR